jgi:glycosyltransferase involved in cell wall biosynthesis
MELLAMASKDAAEGAAPLISVVLCTRNRADLLEKALLSVSEQDFPSSDYEIILVDNASTDRTADVAQRFQGRAPLRYIHEERVGLCIARNTGWRAAKGQIIAYFDDDAIARPGWLRAIHDIFAQSNAATIGVAGGPVAPIWQAPRPAWLADTVASSLTIVDWGPSEKIILDIDREWLVGANMAMRKRVLEEVGGFHPWLDRVGRNLLSSGDVFLQKEILRRGYTCLYVPAMAIEHLVPASRLGKDWFLRRFYWQGVSDAVMHLIERSPSPAGRVRAALARGLQLMRNRRRMRSLLSSAQSPEVFALKCFALLDIGFILGLLGAARH